MVMKFDGSSGLIFPDNSVQPVAAFSSGRSRIDNGDMRWDQRNIGAASTVAVGANNFPVDRMLSIATGAAVTAQRVAGTGAYPYDLLYTGAAGNTEVQFRYHIEAIKCDDLKNKDVTFQLQLSRNVTSDVSWWAYSANAADNWSASTLVGSGTFSAVGSTPLIRAVNFNAGANAANGLRIIVSFGALTAGQTVRVSGLQLEPGTNLLPFERVDPSEMLRRCYRYYERISVPSSGILTVTQANTAAVAIGSFAFSTKRVTPTITLSGPFVALTSSAGNAGGTVTMTGMNESMARVDVSGATGLVAGNASAIYANGTGCVVEIKSEIY